MNPSPQQEAVIRTTAKGQSAVVVAVAGSGKTSTGVMAVEPLSKHIVALAFSTRNEEDLLRRMPPSVLCRNFNKLGMRAWSQKVRQVKIDTRKSGRIRESLKIHFDHWPDFNRVISLLKSQGFVPPNPVISVKPVTPWDSLPEFLANHDYIMPEVFGELEVIDLLGEAMRRSITQAWNGDIDLDDQIYMPAMWGGSFQTFDLIVVDEVQDVNPVQRKLVYELAGGFHRHSQILALGDPYQSIYGFRGADFHSVAKFREEFGCLEMPLTVSFRCPKAIVREAKAIVPEIEPHADAPEGIVDTIAEPKFSPGDVILCRYNRPLVKLAFSLLRQRIPAKVLGRDIGQSLMRLARSMKCQRTYPMLQELRNHFRQKKVEFESKGQWGRAANLEDQCASLAELIKGMGDVTSQDLLYEIDKMFSDKVAPVTLSSIHKAKGLEWPRVFFLDRHLIPSKYAKSEDEIQQEFNAAYVAITRAQRELYYIRSEE